MLSQPNLAQSSSRLRAESFVDRVPSSSTVGSPSSDVALIRAGLVDRVIERLHGHALLLGSPRVSIPADDGASSSDPTNGARAQRWIGSKNGSGVWQQIISEMPPHDVYVEPFLGTGVILKRKRPARYLSIASDVDPAAPALLMQRQDLIVLIGDALGILSALLPMVDWTWLIYCDPPYLKSVRSFKGFYYRYEFSTESQHRELVSLLQTMPCYVMLSGYESALYLQQLHKWRCLRIPTVARNGEKRTECLWMNFEEPFSFHDTRYLGRNFRERERIKRKRQRWINRLRAMSKIDRASILDAISEVGDRD